MTVTLTNVNEDLMKAIKSMVKLCPEVKIRTKKSGIEEGLADIKAGRVETFEDFESYKKAMRR